MKLLTLLTLFLVSLSCFTQTKKEIKAAGITQKEDLQLLRHALLQFDKKSYYEASNDLEQLNDHIEGNEFILFLLGKSYYLSRDYASANEVFGRLIELYPDTEYAMGLFQYAESLKYEGRYAEASMMYSKFKRTKTHSKTVKLAKQWAKNSRKSCQYAQDQILRDSTSFEVSIMSSEINSSYTDFAPVQLAPDQLMFASLRKNDVQYYKHKTNEDQKVNFYISDLEDEAWSEPQLVTSLQDKFDHVANGAVGPDNYFYFTKCLTDYNHKVTCEIYRTKMIKGEFSTKEEKLKSKINKRGYTSTQPTFGYCKKRIGRKTVKVPVMYFASDRPGGAGGMDIWYSVLEDGKFTHPVNCGKRVNTIRDEVTPFYLTKTETLYFSSNYHKGFGGFDVFSSEGKFDKFKTPQNLGMPVNSSYDDTYYSFERENGYLVSNRPGGFALKSETCCDDIYSLSQQTVDTATMEILTTTIYENVVTASVDNFVTTVKKPVANAQIVLIRSFVKDELSRRSDYVTNATYLEYSSFLGQTDKNGRISLKYHLGEFYVLATKEGYKDTLIKVNDITQLEVIMEKVGKPDPKQPIVQLNQVEKNQTLVMKNIHFESNSALLTYDSYESLDDLYTFLVTNSSAKIEVSGHTDNVGSHDSNVELSEDRAETVKEYLIQKGINHHRVKTIGYGEDQPIAENSTPEGQQKNRRIEIKILEK